MPGWASLLIFLFVLWLLGVMEGLQIALVELKRYRQHNTSLQEIIYLLLILIQCPHSRQNPDTYRQTHPAAYRLGQVAGQGDNIERFLMGRQVEIITVL